jgi:PrtD family type I secretion system ABC transporter
VFKLKSRGRPGTARSPIATVLVRCKGAFGGIAVMSGLINILMLTGSIFMMQVYDRVLASHSVPTLVALAIIAVLAYVFQGWLDAIRARILTLIGERIETEVGPKLHVAVLDLPLRSQRAGGETLQPFRDLDAVRGFLSSPGPAALFDLPWMPIYLAFIFFLHPVLGWVTVAGAVFLLLLTISTEATSRAPTKAALEAQSQRNALADAAQKGAEAVRAMGMQKEMSRRWQKAQTDSLKAHRALNFGTGGLSAVARTFRMVLQSAMLGLGAYLAIHNEISAGAIIAASILSARALSPIDQVIGSWKGFIAARQSNHRIAELLSHYPDDPPPFTLPAPTATLAVEGLVVAAPGSRQPIVRRASFTLKAGQGLGIIGTSASGKTSLIRALIGVWQPLAGKVTMDGASIDQWDAEVLGASIGYLPQDVQLFDGTIAENISRFRPDADPGLVIEAATQAGFHKSVVGFPDGYNTYIGQGGVQLSAGQRQRVGLARALFGRPFLIVLDEPNSNLDAEGEAAVSEAIRTVRQRGGIAVVVAHRPSAIAAVDLLAVMRGGEVVAFGPRDEVLAKTVQNASNIISHPAVRSEPQFPATPGVRTEPVSAAPSQPAVQAPLMRPDTPRTRTAGEAGE